MIAANERILQRYHFIPERRKDNCLQDSRRHIDIAFLQLQFPTVTYNLPDSYVSQLSRVMDEDDEEDEADDELTFGHCRRETRGKSDVGRCSYENVWEGLGN
ncbi:hypothetical protein Syun_019072 [Stephania yunnanensis]|uniref:Uncharacterized protein n=1 Tax=Stephania yunnanensis TaxID=152371 RepID=A0AAP0IUK3_9MAGN